jgi:hypothetical protein
LQNKYLKDKTLSQVEAKPTDSRFWKGLMKVKDDLFMRGSMPVGNGQNTRFWEDMYLRDIPLCEQYPSLYRIVNHVGVSVANIMGVIPLNICFRWALSEDRWYRWVHLVTRVMGVQLSENNDTFRWHLTELGLFSVKYLDMLDGPARILRSIFERLKFH